MKVICVDNTGTALPEGIYSYKKSDQFEITIGKEYTVYGIATFKRFQWYLVCEDHFDGIGINYPRFLFSGCFKISDGSLSKFWKIAEDNDVYSYNERTIIFGFEDLVSDKYFYSNLLEGEDREVRVFATIKKVLDSEFTWPS
ncbi:MAG: hypothetical protein ABIN67_24385 [Ferruginibacter sp.]